MAEPKHILDARNSCAYDADFAMWIDHQTELLEARRFAELDVDNLIDEVSALSKREFRSLQSAIRVVILHMLKWDFQPEKRGEGWRKSIYTQRGNVEAILADSPSLRRRIEEAIDGCYESARREAAFQTQVYLENFPDACPYSFEDIMHRTHEFSPDIQRSPE